MFHKGRTTFYKGRMMFHKGSYFKDRIYESSNTNRDHGTLLDENKCEYWSHLLGQDVYKMLTDYSDGFLHYLKNDNYTVWDCGNAENSRIGTLWKYLEEEKWNTCDRQADLSFIKSVTFGSFYEPMLWYAIESFQAGLIMGEEDLKKWITDTVYADFAMGCVNRLQAMCARTLIARMHEYKQEGKLQGASSEEEYCYFCEQYAGTRSFILETLERFPVLYRMVEETLMCMTDFYIEVVRRFQTDLSILHKELLDENGKQKIVKIRGDFADTHNHGRQVLRVGFSDGAELIYKPHSMENEKEYDRLYSWICEQFDLEPFQYSYLTFSDHSWCSVIQGRTCDSREALARYYERFGVHLFLTYLLGTKDLHFENLIAVGEYPALVDLEALVNIYYESGEKTVKEEVLSGLSRSVLYSGLLPYYHWNQSGTGVDSSALSGKKGQKYPFKVPIIVNDKSSDMKVEYYHPLSHTGNNLATLNGEFLNPVLYKDTILGGFSKAYAIVEMRKQEFESLLLPLKSTTSRFLVADTQRYAMIMNSSCHPSLLSDGAEREIFLSIMWQGREPEDRAIVDMEVNSLLDGDIPLFYYRLDETALYSDGKRVVDHYFVKTAYEMILEKLSSLNATDLEKQCDYISLSLEMLDDQKKPYLNRIHISQMPAAENEMDKTSGSKKDHVRVACDKSERKEKVRTSQPFIRSAQYAKNLMRRILKYAVWDQEHTEVSWHTVRFDTSGAVTWELIPMNMYLYDGLAGMLLLMSAWNMSDLHNADISVESRDVSSIKKEYIKEEYIKEEPESEKKVTKQIEAVLRDTLFAYTDSGLQDIDRVNTTKPGALEGEGSILYSYIQLYQMTGYGMYLTYAKKHADIVAQLLDADENHDMLSGNAGAAQVLLSLYQITKEEKYVALAEHAISVLEESRIVQEQGIGWITDPGTPPMSGMAHGNAGIMMPVLTLWKLTGNKKYEALAERIWEYENSLYHSERNNWDDLRAGKEIQDQVGAVSWCHGAPGIMLSRIYGYQLVEDLKWRQRFLQEIQIGYDKLKEYWKRDSWSLCHGNCGNLWMLEQAERFLLQIGILKDDRCCVWEEMFAKCMQNEISYLPQEALNPGLFNGYGGIAYYFLSHFCKKISNVLVIK